MIHRHDPLTLFAALVVAAVAVPCAAVAVRVVDKPRRRGSSVTTMEPTATTFNVCPTCDNAAGDGPGYRWPYLYEDQAEAVADATARHNCAVLYGPAGYWSVPAELPVGDVLAAIGLNDMVTP